VVLAGRKAWCADCVYEAPRILVTAFCERIDVSGVFKSAQLLQLTIHQTVSFAMPYEAWT
jgi:hypothetical protein